MVMNVFHNNLENILLKYNLINIIQVTMALLVFYLHLNPEEHQPSGTCNFSRIDNATLVLREMLNQLLLKFLLFNELQCIKNYEWYGWSCLLKLD